MPYHILTTAPCTMIGKIWWLHTMLVWYCFTNNITAACNTPQLHELGVCKLQQGGCNLPSLSTRDSGCSRTWPAYPTVQMWWDIHHTVGWKYSHSVQRPSHGTPYCLQYQAISWYHHYLQQPGMTDSRKCSELWCTGKACTIPSVNMSKTS
jgi:hypothetical protein